MAKVDLEAQLPDNLGIEEADLQEACQRPRGTKLDRMEELVLGASPNKAAGAVREMLAAVAGVAAPKDADLNSPIEQLYLALAGNPSKTAFQMASKLLFAIDRDGAETKTSKALELLRSLFEDIKGLVRANRKHFATILPDAAAEPSAEVPEPTTAS